MACLNEAMGKGRKTLVLVIAKLRKKYTLKSLLNYTKLAKCTYYDELKKFYKISKKKILKQLLHIVYDTKRKIKETKVIILNSDKGWQYQNKRYQRLLINIKD